MAKNNGKFNKICKSIFSGKAILLLYILLPIVVISVGFASWISFTPTFLFQTSADIKSESLIDTNVFVSVKKFEPHTKQLYYTGPVNEDGEIINELEIETKIELSLTEIYEIAKNNVAEGSNVMYLTLTISFADSRTCSIFGSGTSTESPFDESHLEYNTEPFDRVTVTQVATKPTSSSFSLVLKIDFTQVGDSPIFNAKELTYISPVFVLNSSGYKTLFTELKNSNPKFRLDLRLSELLPNDVSI